MSLGIPNDRSLRSTFNEVAEQYGGVRPPLPEDLIDEIVARSGLPRGGRILEVGPGTGRATVEFARRGYDVTAIELGDALAAVTRRNLAPYPNAEVIAGEFEAWPLPAKPFDVVTAFDAWHWLDPTIALDKAAAALRSGGAFAVVGSDHVEGGDIDFFNEMQPCYVRHDPGVTTAHRLRKADDIPHVDRGTELHAAFDAPEFRRWFQVDEYTTETYFDLIGSFSGNIALAPEHRDPLFACIRVLLETKYGGHIRRAMLFELCVARRR